MKKALPYGLLAVVFLGAPAGVTSYLMARYFHASLLDCRPHYGVLSDEFHYWHEIDSFREVGFDTGYFVVNERPAPARWNHFGPHGPAFPVLTGMLARVFGWHAASGGLFNLSWLALGGAAWLALVRPGPGRLAAAALVLATFWPCLLYVPATLQESFHCGVALVLAGLAHRKLSGADPRNGPFLAVAAVAALVRVTWALAIVAWALAAMRGERWRGRLAALAAVPALFVAWRYVASPYPNAMESLFAAVRDRPLAACSDYLGHIGANLLSIRMSFFQPFSTLFAPPYLPLWQWPYGQPLQMAERYQVAALFLFGVFAALRQFPATRPLAAVTLVGGLLSFAVWAELQVVLGAVIAVAGCWPGRARRKLDYAATGVMLLGLVAITHEEVDIRVALGRYYVYMLYFILLGCLCLTHRDLIVRRLVLPLLPTPAHVRPVVFGWLNVALVSAAVACLYDFKDDRDYRVLAPHLLLSLLVLVAGPAWRLGLGLVAVGLLSAPAFGPSFEAQYRGRFAPSPEVDLRPYLRYDGGRPAWENTVLVTDLLLKARLRVPPGFGVATLVENEDRWRAAAEKRRVLAAPKSRYLFMPPRDAAACGAPPELLYETEYGNLYLNPAGRAE
jgi:hypothetical protein